MRRAVAVGDDHSDRGGLELGVIERLHDGTRDTVAVIANRGEPLRFAGVAAAQHVTQHGDIARCG